MQLVYAHNFRGFSSAHVPLSDVNFFVGENSTGKTSLLNLIRLLSRPEFIFSQSFNSVDVGYAHFEDLVSVTAKDRSVFRVGFVESQSGNRSERHGRKRESLSAALFCFKDNRGLPELCEYVAAGASTRLHVRFDGNRTSFWVIRNTAQHLDEMYQSGGFDRWMHESTEHAADFRRLPTKVPRNAQNQRLFWTMHAIDEHLRSKKEESIRATGIGPFFFDDQLVSLAPIRTKPRRTYDEYKLEFSEEGEHTPYLIRKILSTKREGEKFQDFMRKFGARSGLFEDMKIKRHGRGPTAPFELDVMLNGRALGLNNVGYGVAQALPIVVELFARPRNTAFSIQQPEVHLHPRGQAALGDVIFALATAENKRFFVETHSDYLMDRYRLNYSQSSASEKPTSQILFFDRDSKGNCVQPLAIDSSGKLPADQPQRFRDFFLNEAVRLLALD